jgi:hypothetical protein
MNTQDLKKKLETQLQALGDTGNFQVIPFDVFWVDRDVKEALDAALIRIERKTWSWGHCRSETCNHNSHDPYQDGHTAFVLCRPVGKDERGWQMYATESGLLFGYQYGREGRGRHFAPAASFRLYE